MATTYRWYTRSSVPLIEKTNTKNGDTISVASPYNPVTDTLITEGDYNILKAAYDANVESLRASALSTWQSDISSKAAILASASAKLQSGTPLTSGEADAVTSQ